MSIRKTLCSYVTSVVNYLQKIIKNFTHMAHSGWKCFGFEMYLWNISWIIKLSKN